MGYESYPDVIAWTTFMTSSPDRGLNYEFARIGEESDDTEIDRGGDDVRYYLAVHRNIYNELTEG